jgi:hypothetical protein
MVNPNERLGPIFADVWIVDEALALHVNRYNSSDNEWLYIAAIVMQVVE